MPYRPRATRDFARIRAAELAARACKSSALDVALAQIGTAFDEAAAVNGFKLRIEHLLRFGPQHPAARARFAARAAMLTGRSLDAAIAAVECWWRNERKAFQSRARSATATGSRSKFCASCS